MTCKEVRQNLPDMLEGELQGEFQSHLKTCPSCSELASDLQWIAAEARQLTATAEPPERLWVRIAAELRSEGLIRDPEISLPRPVLATAWWKRKRTWWLAPVAAGLLAAGGYLVGHRDGVNETTAKAPRVLPIPADMQTAEDQQLLDDIARRAPVMRATYENELRSVNASIRDAEAYAQQNPADVEARRYLHDAYQQKAMLYQMALDHIQ